MALKGHRFKTKRSRRKRWSKRASSPGCKYGKLKHPRGRRICRKTPK